MAEGIQGAFEVFTNLPQSIFVSGTAGGTVVNISVLSRSQSEGTIRIAVTNNEHEIQDTDAILEWDLPLNPGAVFERTGIIVPGGQYLTVESTASPLSVQAWGLTDGAPIVVTPTAQNLGDAPIWNSSSAALITNTLQTVDLDITDEGPVTVSLTSGTLPQGVSVSGSSLKGTMDSAVDTVPSGATEADFLLDLPGTYTITVPSGVSAFSNLSAVVVGGGGGGGGSDNTDYGGGGGGGGGLAFVNNIALSGGEVITITVGDGGAGTRNGYGVAGTPSILKIDDVEVLRGGAGGGGYIGGDRDGFNNFTTYANGGTFTANASYGLTRGGGNGGGSGGNYNGGAGGGGAGGFNGNGARGPKVNDGSGYEIATGTGAGGGGSWSTYPAAGDGSSAVAGVEGGQGGSGTDSSAGGGGGGSWLWSTGSQNYSRTIIASGQDGEDRSNQATNTEGGHGAIGGFPGGGGGGGYDQPGYWSVGGHGARGAARLVFTSTTFNFPTDTNVDSATRYVYTSSDAYSTTPNSINVALTATDEVGNTTPTAFAIIRKWKDGSTEALANTSAKEIKKITGTDSNEGYWIKPEGEDEAFFVHCYMNSEYDGGGWMLVLRNDSDFSSYTGGWPSSSFLVSNWAGWAYSNRQQIEDLGYNYSTHADSDSFAPTYALCPFTDVMVIANRTGQQSKRIGWRHTSGFDNMVSVINQSATQKADEILFGNPYNWLSALDVRGDTNIMEPNNDFVGFKIRSDTGSTSNSSNYTGGFFTSSMHYGSQIGCGRDNSNSNVWGGGYGGYYANARYHKMHGHWWNHGDQRFSGSDRSQVFYGHGVYIR